MRHSFSHQWFVLFSAFFIVFFASTVQGKTLYKVYDDNGQLIFTDQKPKEGDGVEIHFSKELNVIKSGKLSNRTTLQHSGSDSRNSRYLDLTPEQLKLISESYKKQLVREGLLPASVLKKSPPKQTKDPLTVYKQALEAQKKGKETTNDDWQRTQKGRRFLKPSYFKRQEELQKKVDSAKKQLN